MKDKQLAEKQEAMAMKIQKWPMFKQTKVVVISDYVIAKKKLKLK